MAPYQCAGTAGLTQGAPPTACEFSHRGPATCGRMARDGHRGVDNRPRSDLRLARGPPVPGSLNRRIHRPWRTTLSLIYSPIGLLRHPQSAPIVYVRTHATTPRNQDWEECLVKIGWNAATVVVTWVGGTICWDPSQINPQPRPR